MARIWKNSGREYPSLDRNVKCGAAVIGGGLTGVLLAYLLSERGIDTVLFESERIASGKTGLSTAKVTVAHGLAYSEIAEHISAEAAEKYAAANMAGLRVLEKHLQPAEMRDMYLYALYGERRLMREYEHMRESGIECEYVAGGECPLPFTVTGAIRLRCQYAADPVELTHRLCNGGHFQIYENSPAEHIERHGFNCLGHTVRADFVAVCTNYPVHISGAGSPVKLSRKSSTVAVMRSENGFSMPDIMAFGADGGYGYRYAGDCLIVSGETGRTVPPNAVERLVSAVRSFAPDAFVEETWVNNDTYSHDAIPYAGRLRSGIYTACGYSAWGMTTSAAAAVILESMISGHELWYADIFSPDRNFLSGGSSQFAEHLSVAASGMLAALGVPPDRYASSVGIGEAAVVSRRGNRVGAYRDSAGEMHIVSLKCPHLGCALEWNPVDSTWDCPCHGSRFSYTGKCISNPAERGIAIE